MTDDAAEQQNPSRPPLPAKPWLLAAFGTLALLFLFARTLGLWILLAWPLLAAGVVAIAAWLIVRRRRFDQPRFASAVAAAVIFCAGWFCLFSYLALDKHIAGGRSVSCRFQLRAIANAVDSYSAANGGLYPPSLQVLLDTSHLADPEALICPDSDDRPLSGLSADEWSSFAYAPILDFGSIPRPGTVPIAWDKKPHRRGHSVNTLFADLHLSWPPYADFAEELERSRRFYTVQPKMPIVPERFQQEVTQRLEHLKRGTPVDAAD